MVTTLNVNGTAVDVKLEVHGDIALKSAAYIPARDEYDDAEIVLEFDIGSIGDCETFDAKVLLRDGAGNIVGKEEIYDDIMANSRHVASIRSSSFPQFSVLDLIGRAR